VKINQISLDESGDHVGVCSEDGKVIISFIHYSSHFSLSSFISPLWSINHSPI